MARLEHSREREFPLLPNHTADVGVVRGNFRITCSAELLGVLLINS